MNPKANILILGLHPHISDGVLELLRAGGFDGDSVTNAEAAGKIAATTHFDLLLVGGAIPIAEQELALENMRKSLPNIQVQRNNPFDHKGPIDYASEALAKTASSV